MPSDSAFPPPPATFSPLRILLAEDHALNRMLALQMLALLGYRADVALNGLEVLQMLRCKSYDLVLMDVKMPMMDGLTATRQICQEWSADRPRIIAMTASGLQSDYDNCIAAGVDDYLAKPIKIPTLRQALSQCQPKFLQKATPDEALSTSLDAKAQQNLYRIQNQEVLAPFDELIKSYLAVSPQLLQEIQSAIDQNQPEVLKLAARSLNLISAVLGENTLSEICNRLEAIDETQMLTAAAAAQQLATELHRVKAALEVKRQTRS